MFHGLNLLFVWVYLNTLAKLCKTQIFCYLLGAKLFRKGNSILSRWAKKMINCWHICALMSADQNFQHLRSLRICWIKISNTNTDAGSFFRQTYFLRFFQHSAMSWNDGSREFQFAVFDWEICLILSRACINNNTLTQRLMFADSHFLLLHHHHHHCAKLSWEAIGKKRVDFEHWPL